MSGDNSCAKKKRRDNRKTRIMPSPVGLVEVSGVEQISLYITLEDGFLEGPERSEALDDIAQYGDVYVFPHEPKTVGLECTAYDARLFSLYFKAGALDYVTSILHRTSFGKEYKIQRRTA